MRLWVVPLIAGVGAITVGGGVWVFLARPALEMWIGAPPPLDPFPFVCAGFILVSIVTALIVRGAGDGHRGGA
jgi:hypothetical protein